MGMQGDVNIKNWPPRVWVALALLVLIVIFIFQNGQTATVHLPFIAVQAPMWITLLACVVVGILIGVLGRRKSKADGK
ncbi:LapA family protein [Nonomuraea sp. NPDC050556]|uniref:LapA family protein n=1 Tax=Nonomuraea sp. NPDC050556 TaxID=3364369 RepID=UPI00379EC90B